MRRKFLIVFLLLFVSLVPKVFSNEICYIGKKDSLYNEIIDRGYTVRDFCFDCKRIVVNSETPIELNFAKMRGAEKIIYVNIPPKAGCVSRANYNLKKFGKGKLIITKYHMEEEFDEFKAIQFDKPIMKPLGNYIVDGGSKPIIVAFRKIHQPVEYYAFDITKSEKLMDILFPKTKKSSTPPPTPETQKQQKTEKIGKDGSSFKQKILLAMLFGLLLNIPVCMIVFTSGALEESNRNIVYNFMIGRAVGLLTIGAIFIKIIGYFQMYNHLFTLGFGIMCIGIAFGTYKKKEFCKNAFSWTGGFLKGVTPCMKLTPVFPLLIGLSLPKGIIIMLVFIGSSTIYFLLLFFFGVKLLEKFSIRLNKKYTSVLFLIFGLYFIWKGLHIT